MFQVKSSVGLVCVGALGLLAGAAIGAPEYRSLDGSGNNMFGLSWGSADSNQVRIGSANYVDGIGSVDLSRPNARSISNAVFTQSAPSPDARGLSEITWLWGQFIDHDMTLTRTSPDAGTLGVTIPFGDPTFDNGTVNLGGETITMTRSMFGLSTGVTTPRQQVNSISSYLDASMVYGGEADGGARADWLRSGMGGRLKVSDGGDLGDLLPRYENGAPTMDNINMPTMGSAAFVAGDIRANEHTGLAAMHTLWVREHNRIADAISAGDPGMSDEDVYQRARKIVGAAVQKVTYDEFLPAMGVSMDAYSGYDSTVDATIANEFSAAGFRVGHTMIRGSLARMDSDWNMAPSGELSLADAFFNPSTLMDGGIDQLLRGMSRTYSEAIDAQMVDEVRNQLFSIFVPGDGLVNGATDLASINIMRGRDHGLGTYNQTRAAYGLSEANEWADMTSNIEVQAALASVYDSVDDVDLWVGMLVEDQLLDSSLGELVNAILSDQFTRLRDGDRFFWKNLEGGINDDLFDMDLDFAGTGKMTAWEWIEGMSLSDVMALNTGITGLPDNVFYVVPTPAAFALIGSVGLMAARRRRG